MSFPMDCSFCGKSEVRDLVRILVGPGVCICDECVGVCAEMLADGAREKNLDVLDEEKKARETRGT